MKNEEKRYYWIKLKTNFFSIDEIDFLLSQENGCKYVVLYQMLCLNTANNNGNLCTRVGEMIVPYDVDKIVRDTKYFDIDTVIVALELFKKLGLIYEEENNVFKISNFDEMVGSETSSAKRVREYRERKKLLQCNTDVTQEYRDKSIENRDKSIDIRDKVPYEKIKDLFHEICVSFPKVMKLNDARKKTIKTRYNEYNSDIEIFRTLFTKAEKSNFLKGNNDNNWSATFDWLLKAQNMIKVLEGNYENKQSTFTNKKKPIRKEIVPEWFDKKIESEPMSKEELEELEKELKSFNDDWKEEAKALEKELKEKY